MNLKLLLKKPLFYFGILVLFAGIIILFFDEKSLLGAISAQAGFILCLWAWRKTRIVDEQQKQLQRKARIFVIALFCICFMLLPIIALVEIQKITPIVLGENIIMGVVGLLGLVGLSFWYRK